MFLRSNSNKDPITPIELKEFKVSTLITAQEIKQILDEYKQKKSLVKSIGIHLPYSREMNSIIHFYEHLPNKNRVLSAKEYFELIEILSKITTLLDTNSTIAVKSLKEKISFSLWPSLEKVAKFHHNAQDLKVIYENPQHATKIANAIAVLNTKSCIHCVAPEIKHTLYKHPAHSENIANAYKLLNRVKISQKNIINLCNTYPEIISEISKAYLTLWKLKLNEEIIYQLINKYHLTLTKITAHIDNIIAVLKNASYFSALSAVAKFIETNKEIEFNIFQLNNAFTILQKNHLLDHYFTEEIINKIFSHPDKSSEIATAFVNLNAHHKSSCESCFDFTFKNIDQAKIASAIISLLTKAYIITHPLSLNSLYQAERYLNQSTVSIMENLFETKLLSYENFALLMENAQHSEVIFKLMQSETHLNQEKINHIFNLMNNKVSSPKCTRLKFFDSSQDEKQRSTEEKVMESSKQLSLA